MITTIIYYILMHRKRYAYKEAMKKHDPITIWNKREAQKLFHEYFKVELAGLGLWGIGTMFEIVVVFSILAKVMK